MTISTTPAATTSRRTRAGFWWLALSAVTIAVVAPLPYLTTPLAVLARENGAVAAGFVDRPAVLTAALYAHIVGGGLALLLSPLQLAGGVRRRVPRLHRFTGRVVLAAIAGAGAGGLLLAPFNHAGPIGTAGFGLLAVAWLTCAFLAYRTIRRGDVPAHRRWAVRTFALTYAAVTLRLWLLVLIGAQTAAGVGGDVAFDRAYVVVPFLCWVPNLWLAIRMTPRVTQPSVTALTRTGGARS